MYVSERMCARGPCSQVQALGNWLCLCSRPFMDHRPLLAHFPAHTHTRSHTRIQSSQQLHPSPLLPTISTQTQLPGNKKWNMREKGRSKGRRRRGKGLGNELTWPQEVEINKYEEWVGGRETGVYCSLWLESGGSFNFGAFCKLNAADLVTCSCIFVCIYCKWP